MDLVITNRQEAEYEIGIANHDIEAAERGMANARDSESRTSFEEEKIEAQSRLRQARVALEEFPEYA